jgi:hypothetical protein
MTIFDRKIKVKNYFRFSVKGICCAGNRFFRNVISLFYPVVSFWESCLFTVFTDFQW